MIIYKSERLAMAKNLKVLLIDDSTIILTVMSEVLASISCVASIKTSSAPVQALQTIEEFKPDVLLLDINMPEKNGIEVLKEVKEHYPAVKVIMLTNHSTEYYRNTCYNIGAYHFIDKANEFDQIAPLMEKISTESDEILKAM
ncbi:response regulator transcription factor [Hydrotalea flava]|uniref:response regulator transcription factor n=1 Tax=Hydrotalea flava TaxID=714549 RepID=UPI00082BFBAD|nr:response regulator [Hydrotalea flava]